MPSGNRREILHTRERILSTDHNRLQTFLSADIAGLLQSQVDVRTTDQDANGLEGVGTAVGNPLRGVIQSGIRVRPEIGTLNTFVEPGLACLVDPDAVPDSDDVPYKWVRDPGVQLAGSLVLTPGAGSARIDMVECQRVDTVLESDNRDIFDPTTGLFTAVSVDKVAASRLNYRIRTGTPGGGFAGLGTAAGWLPLAVALVPAAAASWDACTVWDVRPLVSDFVHSPFRVDAVHPTIPRGYAQCWDAGVANDRIVGLIESSFRGRRVGGELCPPGEPATSLSIQAMLDPAFVGTTFPWYIYLLQPFGLPRWAKYSPSASGSRIPRSPRGIPCVANQPPDGYTGEPVNPVGLPTATGLGGTSDEGVCVAAGLFTAAVLEGFTMADGWTTTNAVKSKTPSSGAGTVNLTYDIVLGADVPPNAVEVEVQFFQLLTGVAGTSHQVAVSATLRALGGVAGATVLSDNRCITFPVGGTFLFTSRVRIPLQPNYPNTSPGIITNVVDYDLGITPVGPTLSLQTMIVTGWKLGVQ